MKRPACGAAELIHDTRDPAYTYKQGRDLRHPGGGGGFLPCA
jgi:hypothetical protein